MANMIKKIALLGMLGAFILGGFAADKKIADSAKSSGQKLIDSVQVKETKKNLPPIKGVNINAADKKIADGTKPTGLKPIDAAQINEIRRTLPRVKKVNVNKLGFERVNKAKARRGIKALDPKVIRPLGQELESSIDKLNVSTQAAAPNPDLFGSLPAQVDNSTLKYFPPIRNQDPLNSCSSFATTYVQFSYMTALQKDLDIKNGLDTDKYSPKWTYNMVNGGLDDGSYILDNYKLLENHGAATWDEFPYDGNYLAWCLTPAIWRNALSTRTKPTQYVSGANTDIGIEQIKELLTNGYILVFGTFIDSWQGQIIMDDPATPDDDPEVGKGIGYWLNGILGSHAMTIVGYNDAIWADVNGNAVVDPGEKGAFRIANSWGDEWQDAGFVWLAYDALRTVSALPDGPTEGRQGATQEGYAFVMTARNAYSPVMIAEFTVNHAKRGQLGMTLGSSDTSMTFPATEWTPGAIQYQGGAYAFDGSTTPLDGTFVFDFSDLVSTAGGTQRYYLGMRDIALGDPATLSAFKIIDLTADPDGVGSSDPPLSADNGQQVYAYVDYAYSGPSVNHPPVLSSAQVDPIGGTTADTFYFFAYYYDQDGDSPSVKDVYIDETPYAMSLVGGFPAYDGWYIFETVLPADNHNYRFYFEDAHGEVARAPVAGTINGPVVTIPHFVTLPNIPSGQLTPVRGTPYTYSTSGSTCVLGHSIQYRFDWGDSSISDWLPVGQASAQHSWTSSGSHAVRAQARCATETAIESSWSAQLIVTVPTSIPYSESFPSSGFPAGWIQQNIGTDIYSLWNLVPSNEAGGQAYEMRCIFQNVNPGTSRLVTSPINTTGYSTLRLQFKHFLQTWEAGGVQLKIQTSTDRVTWTDEAWTMTTTDANIGPETVDTILTHNLNSETTFVGFVVTGDLYMFSYWYIDDISITQAPKLRMFVKSTADTSIWINTMTSDETYEGWQVMSPGGTTTTPAIGVYNNALHLIVKDSADNKMWYRSMNGTGAWGDWSLLYGLSPSTASMAAFNNKLYLVVRGSDDRIYYRSMDTSGVWGSWGMLSPGATTTTPVVASFNGKLHLVVKSSVDTSIWWNSMDTTEAWSGWQQLYGLTPDPVAMVEYNNRLYMFVRGTDDNIYYRYLNTEGTWGSWTAMYGKTTISPTVAAFNERLYLIVKSSVDSTIWMRSMDTEETWGNWSIMPGLTMIPVAVGII